MNTKSLKVLALAAALAVPVAYAQDTSTTTTETTTVQEDTNNPNNEDKATDWGWLGLAGLLGLGSVALDGGQGGQGARTVREGAIREVLGGLQSSVSGTPDLLVVDAAAHGLDDLHYPHTLTLSVGRVQGGRASLSLNGQADTAQAAQFLARVAETLEKPIVLVL